MTTQDATITGATPKSCAKEVRAMLAHMPLDDTVHGASKTVWRPKTPLWMPKAGPQVALSLPTSNKETSRSTPYTLIIEF
ncbi:hypothetical protein HYC85_013115 [Camellia sinensis]|uniref:Uncharacterized protein n=1 Tax=Camellia sinensis TaxID=4442 RepID=A0A7J7H628_CAMSI|nr:hypothetical protein HYC85_013115 [Camellia sinensis]